MKKDYLKCNSYGPAILLVICLVSSSFATLAFAPPVKVQVKGVVLDAATGTGVSYATVSVQTAKEGIKMVAADSDGKFELLLHPIQPS